MQIDKAVYFSILLKKCIDPSVPKPDSTVNRSFLSAVSTFRERNSLKEGYQNERSAAYLISISKELEIIYRIINRLLGVVPFPFLFQMRFWLILQMSSRFSSHNIFSLKIILLSNQLPNISKNSRKFKKLKSGIHLNPLLKKTNIKIRLFRFICEH